MLSRFFSTSQPFHYLMGILTLILGGSLLMFALEPQWEWELLIGVAMLPFAMLIIQFIIVKNELTGQNSYGLFVTTMLLLTMVVVGAPVNKLGCLLLLLLALRRLLSLKKDIDTIRKIFDASFWICIAAIIQPLMSVFLVAIFVGIFLFARSRWQYWAVPFLAIICVALLGFVIELYTGYEMISSLWNSSNYQLKFLWSDWQPMDLIPWILSIAGAIGLLIYIIKLADIQQRVRPRFSVLVFSGICALFLGVVMHSDYLLMLIPSLAIFLVRSIEVIKHKVVKEILFLLPVFLLITALLLR